MAATQTVRLQENGLEILTNRRTRRRTEQGTLIFKPCYVQRGMGPHLRGEYGYASDSKWDAFHSNFSTSPDGVAISDTEGVRRFGINVRWNVESFGFPFILADNGGEFYELPPSGQTRVLNLNYELARSRVVRNRARMTRLNQVGRPSRELHTFVDLSEGYLEDADKAVPDESKRAALSQKALSHALWASEMMELERARLEIAHRGRRGDFFFGCDARAFYEMDPDVFLDRFTNVFDYATVTYVIDGGYNLGNFEPTEDRERYDRHDVLVNRLRNAGVTVEGRPLFWFHTWVTPDWIKEMNYDRLLGYVERHTREVVGHYGDQMYAWEIVNELHDWANETGLTPEQTVELTRLACEVARDTAPAVKRLVNNCCPFAEYVQMGRWSGQEARYPQRTPWEFTKDLVDAGVDFSLIGHQMYFPYRDLQDTIMMVERYEEFGKRIQFSEVGCPGGVTERSVKLGTVNIPDEPHVWRRHWDEELQADWLEAVFTFAYSNPTIEAANWFDFVDPFFYIDNGGLLRSPRGEPKAAYKRLQKIRKQWADLLAPRLDESR